jgi:hypothetical protein
MRRTPGARVAHDDARIESRLEEAALLVALAPRVLTRITLPLLWPPIASSALLTFVLALSDHAVPNLLRQRVFTTEMFTAFAALYDPNDIVPHDLQPSRRRYRAGHRTLYPLPMLATEAAVRRRNRYTKPCEQESHQCADRPRDDSHAASNTQAVDQGPIWRASRMALRYASQRPSQAGAVTRATTGATQIAASIAIAVPNTRPRPVIVPIRGRVSAADGRSRPLRGWQP